MTSLRPVAAAGVVCLKGPATLLIRRGRPPLEGAWSLPGGKIEFGETAGEAALRELREKTGVEAALLGLLDVVDLIAPDGSSHYLLVDFAATWLAGTPAPADDALEAHFVEPDALCDIPLWDQTRRIIAMAHARYGAAGGNGS